MTAFALHRPHPVEGAPQVWLLHGVFTDHRLWRAVWPQLDGLDVVALDAPGHGSAAGPGAGVPPLDDVVEVLAGLLRTTAPGPVLLAGHSWGGMTALRLAVRHPDLVRGLLLTGTPLLATRGRGRLGFLGQLALLAAGFPLGAYGRLAAGALYGADHRRRHPEVADATAATVRALGRRRTQQVLRRVLLEPADAVDLLREVRVPVAVLAGAEDYVASPELRARVAATGHEVQVHPGGHMGPAEAPDHVAAALLALARTAVG